MDIIVGKNAHWNTFQLYYFIIPAYDERHYSIDSIGTIEHDRIQADTERH